MVALMLQAPAPVKIELAGLGDVLAAIAIQALINGFMPYEFTTTATRASIAHLYAKGLAVKFEWIGTVGINERRGQLVNGQFRFGWSNEVMNNG